MSYRLYEAIREQVHKENMSPLQFAQGIGFSAPSYYLWKSGKGNAQQRSWDAFYAYVASYNRAKGIDPDLSPRNQYAQQLSEMVTEAARPDAVDTESLRQMGLTLGVAEGDKHHDDAMKADEWYAMRMIATILNSSHLSESEKQRLCGRDFPKLFPASSRLAQ